MTLEQIVTRAEILDHYLDKDEAAATAKRNLPGMAEPAIRCVCIQTGTTGMFIQTIGCTWGLFHGDNGAVFTVSRLDVKTENEILSENDEIAMILAK